MTSSTARFLITALALFVGGVSGLASFNVATAQQQSAKQWSVPLAGNSFPASPRDGRAIDARSGLRLTAAAEEKDAAEFSAYFRISNPAELQLSFAKAVSNGAVKAVTTINGERFVSDLGQATDQRAAIGNVNVKAAGYVELNIKAIGQGSATLGEIIVESDTADLKVDFVQSNDGNMFYWGRRGPSVHLRYSVPRDRKLQYAYSELTVPKAWIPSGRTSWPMALAKVILACKSTAPANGACCSPFGVRIKPITRETFPPTNAFNCWARATEFTSVSSATKAPAVKATCNTLGSPDARIGS